MKNELVLAVEGVVVQDGRRGGAEVVQLEVALLAGESVASAILLAAAAGEELGESDLHQWVFGVGVMRHPLSRSRLWRRRKLHRRRRHGGGSFHGERCLRSLQRSCFPSHCVCVLDMAVGEYYLCC